MGNGVGPVTGGVRRVTHGPLASLFRHRFDRPKHGATLICGAALFTPEKIALPENEKGTPKRPFPVEYSDSLGSGSFTAETAIERLVLCRHFAQQVRAFEPLAELGFQLVTALGRVRRADHVEP